MNGKMKSLVVDRGGKLEVRELPIPSYNEYQALVKMIAGGICGTDRKLVHGNFKNFDTYPAILGHEGVGMVVEKGSKVENYNNGDIVLLPFVEGKLDDCYPGWGAFSEYAVVGDAKALIKAGYGPGSPLFSEAYYAQQVIPKDIDPVGAVMIVTFREVYSATKHFGFEPNKSIVIFGAGPVGLCFVRFSKLMGMGPIIVFDIVDNKLDEAISMGADFAFNSKKVNVKETVKQFLPEGADFVVEAVGYNPIINQAMELVKYNGKICCYGVSPELKMELDWTNAPYNWTLQFVQWPSKYEEGEAFLPIVNLIKLGVLNPHDFISDVIPFENIIEAFKMMEEGKFKKKAVIKF